MTKTSNHPVLAAFLTSSVVTAFQITGLYTGFTVSNKILSAHINNNMHLLSSSILLGASSWCICGFIGILALDTYYQSRSEGFSDSFSLAMKEKCNNKLENFLKSALAPIASFIDAETIYRSS